MPEGHEIRWWWEQKQEIDLSWENILTFWDQIETDFHHFYNTDFGDGVLHKRTWRWFATRVTRLLAEESALSNRIGLTAYRNKKMTGESP